MGISHGARGRIEEVDGPLLADGHGGGPEKAGVTNEYIWKHGLASPLLFVSGCYNLPVPSSPQPRDGRLEDSKRNARWGGEGLIAFSEVPAAVDGRNDDLS